MALPVVRADLRSLEPHQCGVGVTGACPLLAMGLQQQVAHLHGRQRTDWAVLQLDFCNAFNTLQRSHMLSAIARRCPAALPWARTCYASHTPLYYGDAVVVSASRVQQGDPVGPAGFCWGIQDLVEDLSVVVEWSGW